MKIRISRPRYFSEEDPTDEYQYKKVGQDSEGMYVADAKMGANGKLVVKRGSKKRL